MKRAHIAACLYALLIASPTFAADEPAYADNLTGDWGGARSKLANRGVEVSLDYSGELWDITTGGLKQTDTYIGLATLGLALDGEKLFGIKGNSMNVALLQSHGAHTNASSIGSTQGISNVEVGENGTRLFEAWVNQEFFDGRLAVLLGLHDLNSEFAATPMSDNFLKPVMQIGQTFAASGRNSPSVYPVSSLAGRLRIVPVEHTYIALAAYDGVSGDPDHPRSNPINLNDKDGVLWVGEVGYTPPAEGSEDALNKLALGVWSYSVDLDDLNELDSNSNPAKTDARGAYLLSSYRFYHDKKTGRDMGVFLRGGVADGDTSQVSWDYETGLVANGWIPGREEGQFGLGLAQAHNGSSYMRAQDAASTPTDRNETSYELYYRDHVWRGVSLQPDMQYVVNPGTDTVTDDALVLGLRADVSF